MTNFNFKPFLLQVFFLISTVVCLAQKSSMIDFSGIIMANDSVPLPNVSIINLKTGKTVSTNEEGFFHTIMAEDDSILVYHISYKRMFLHFNDNLHKFYMVPDAQELPMVNVIADSKSIQEKAKALSSDIVRIALSKKLEGYDKQSRQEYFYGANGSHNKAFSPYFGPSVHLSISQIARLFSGKKKVKTSRTPQQLPEEGK